MGDKTLEFKQKVNAPPADVYRAFTHQISLTEWLSDGAQVNASEGGRFYAWWNEGYYACGEFTALKENERVEFSWHGRGEPAPTTIKVSLKPDGEGTLVTLVHGGLGSGGDWDKMAEEATKGWTNGLENLASVIETGIDLRLARLPLMGIYPGPLVNEENVEKYGVPQETRGVVVDGVIEGLGAEAAGLQKGDVLVSVAGFALDQYTGFQKAFQDKKAGDPVEAEFYRGDKKHTVQMKLSQRPMPEVSPEAGELAEAVRKIIDEAGSELGQIIDGVTDEQASHHPAEGEWNAKEVTCHLILTQRDLLSWIAQLTAGGQELPFTPHTQPRFDALIAIHPTLADLYAELRRRDAEIINLLAALPEEFVNRKSSYVRMGQNLLQLSFHTQTHLTQIREAIQAAGA